MTFALHPRLVQWMLHLSCISVMLVVAANSAFAQTRSAIPSVEKQKECTKLLQETYNLAKLDGAAKKQNTLKQLADASRDEAFGTDERYVILTTIITLAKETGDGANWLEAVNSLVAGFDIDPQKEKRRLLTEFLSASKAGAQIKPVVEEALAVAQMAAQENQYADANAILGAADSAVKRAVGAASLKPVVAAARVAIAAREKEWKSFQAAAAKLETNADDPIANYTVGRWHALQIVDWKTALPFLAKASDAKWKAAAELERTEPTDAMAQAAVGDAWWDIAQKEPAASKPAVLLHAGEWYEEVQPELTSALKKQLVTKRLEEIASVKTGDSNTFVPPKSTASGSKSSQGSKPTKPGEWIDLLAWTEGADWSKTGINWNEHIVGQPTKDGIRLTGRDCAHFPLSAIIDGDYEMEAKFTRFEGSQDAAVHCPIGNHTMRLLLGSTRGDLSVVSFMNGKDGAERRPGTFSNGEPHRVFIRVRHDGEKASFSIDFDEVKDYLKWEGMYSALRDVDQSPWKTTILRHIWIGSVENNLVFNQVRVRMLSGTITRDSVSAADRQQDLKSGLIRLVGEMATVKAPYDGISASANAGLFSINQLGWPPRVLERWPRVAREFRFCDDYYGAHAPSRLKCPIPTGAKSFSVVGFNCATGSSKYRVEIDGKQIYGSPVANIDVIKFDLPAKASFLDLIADPDGDSAYDHVYWCYPRFHAVKAERVTDAMLDGKPGPLRFEVASSEIPATPLTRNKPIGASGPVHFRDAVPCHEFIFAHAPSSIKYDVPDGMSRFTAIGLTPLSNSAKYEVLADGKLIYKSPQAGVVSIDAKLPAQTKSIELKVDPLGDAAADHSYWCYPRLHRD